MRTVKLFIFVLTAATLTLSAARSAGAATSLGAMGGLTRSEFNGDAPDNGKYQSLNGFAFGGICEFDLTRNVKLSVQPSLVRKGTKITYEVWGKRERVDSVDIRVDYLSVPVLFKAMTRGGRFYVSGGMELGFPIKAEYETSSGKTEIDEDLAGLDLAADFAIGYHIPMGRPVMLLELRYTQSIGNIVDTQSAGREVRLQPRIKNSGTQFYIGMLYRL